MKSKMIESRYDGGSSSSSSSSLIRRCSNKDNNKNYNMNSGGLFLCEELLINILCRLPGKSIVRFKCVSKGWYFLISNEIIPRFLPLRFSGLYVCYRNRGLKGIIYVSMNMADIRNNFVLGNMWPRCFSSSSEPPPPVLNKELPLGCRLPFKVNPSELMDSCNGLFLFFNRDLRQFYLWGCEPPQFVLIPPSSEVPRVGCAALAFSIKESVHFKVVQFDEICFPRFRPSPYVRRLEIFYSETGKWVEYKVQYKPPLDRYSIVKRSVYLDGAMYRLSWANHLVRYDLEQVIITSIELPVSSTTGILLGTNTMGCLGLSSGCLHYVRQEDSQVLLIWMLFGDDQWILKHSVSFQELTKIPSSRDFFLEIPLTSSGFRPLAFHPCCDAVFLWSFRTILLYYYKRNEIQVVHCPPDDDKNPLINPPHLAFPYSQCLVHLKSIG